MLIRCLNKMEKIKMTTKKITPPNGWPKDKPWTEKDAAEAMAAADWGLSRSDFTDTGEDLQELKEIVEGN
jgi:hypothetical protein